MPVSSVSEVVGLSAGVSGLSVRGGSFNETQFMVDGLVLNDERRERIWARLSPETRAQFYWPKPLDVFVDDGATDAERIDPQSLRDAPVHPHFFLFKVVSKYVDYLSLGERHRRWISQRSGRVWECVEVNP